MADVMTIDQIYRDNLRALIAAAGSQAAFCEATGKSQSQVSQWLNASPDSKTGKPRSMSQRSARELERLTGQPEGWMDREHVAAVASAPSPLGSAGALVQVAGMAPASGAAGLEIPLLANSASMGPGTDGITEDVIQGTLTVSPDWIAQNVRSTRSDALRFIHGHGDSMAPTFNSGDVLLVDTGVKDVKVDGVYVLRAHDRLFIKRVRQRIDGVHEISSDNPTHKTVDTLNGDHNVEVLGRVVWAWNGKRL